MHNFVATFLEVYGSKTSIRSELEFNTFTVPFTFQLKEAFNFDIMLDFCTKFTVNIDYLSVFW